jgi:hypothetical protein
MLLYALAQVPIAQLAPTSWRWPERLATRVLDEGGQWEAGQRLMQSAAPESWALIVAASPLSDANRETVQRCRGRPTKRVSRCAVRLM